MAEYDRGKPVKVSGTVTKVEWQNPHIWFYVDVKDDAGKRRQLGVLRRPPRRAPAPGHLRNAMKVGDVVVVAGIRARDGSNNASGGAVTFADGRQVFTASPEDARPEGVR